jgi:hypothetical protein
MVVVTSTNVLQNNETKVKWNQQNIFLLKNGYGMDLFNVQIKNPILHPTTVAFANNKAILLMNVLLLRKMYGMQW